MTHGDPTAKLIVVLPEPVRRAFKAATASNGTSMAEVVRALIVSWLSSRKAA